MQEFNVEFPSSPNSISPKQIIVAVIMALALNIPLWLFGGSNESDGQQLFFQQLETFNSDEYQIRSGYYKLQLNFDEENCFTYNTSAQELNYDFIIKRQSFLYQFQVKSENVIKHRIVFVQDFENDELNGFSYLVTNPQTLQTIKIKSEIRGNIPEHRAAEILEKAMEKEIRGISTDGNQIISINDKNLEIVEMTDIVEELKEIILKYNLQESNIDLVSMM